MCTYTYINSTQYNEYEMVAKKVAELTKRSEVAQTFLNEEIGYVSVNLFNLYMCVNFSSGNLYVTMLNFLKNPRIHTHTQYTHTHTHTHART